MIASVPEKITTWGKAILVSAAILTGAATIAKKTVATVTAGEEAKVKAEGLEKRVSRVERMVRFVVRDVERRSGRRYQDQEDAE